MQRGDGAVIGKDWNPPGNEPIEDHEFDDSLVDIRDCRDLWAAKLLVYLKDALRDKARSDAPHPKIAQNWFGTFDFRQTCVGAGLEPEHVMECFKHRLSLLLEGRSQEAMRGLEQGVRQ